MTQDFKQYILWADYGSEGWSPVATKDTFEEIVTDWHSWIQTGLAYCIITEYIKPFGGIDDAKP